MIPVSLYLRNFKSYGEDTPVLDFSQFDIALLSGENGNGKSSLADAIAWCVWGKCKGMDGRGGIDDLIRTALMIWKCHLLLKKKGIYTRLSVNGIREDRSLLLIL